MSDVLTVASESEASRSLRRRKSLPTGRAVVGGFFVIVAAVGAFAAYAGATAPPDTTWVVATRPIGAGARIERADLGAVAIELPPVMQERLFDANGTQDLTDAIALAPIAPGELIEASDVVRAPAGLAAAEEISFSVSIDRAVAGTLQAGERVDVIATYPDACTRAVVRRALLLDSRSGDPDGVILTLGLDRPDQSAAVADAMNSAKIVVVRTNASVDTAAPTGTCAPAVARPAAGSGDEG